MRHTRGKKVLAKTTFVRIGSISAAPFVCKFFEPSNQSPPQAGKLSFEHMPDSLRELRLGFQVALESSGVAAQLKS
jgi:hypothetical protein